CGELRDAGVDEHRVEPHVLVGETLREFACAGGRACVIADRERGFAMCGFAERQGRRRERSFVATGDDYTRALGRKSLGSDETHSAVAAGHEYGFSFKAIHDVLL